MNPTNEVQMENVARLIDLHIKTTCEAAVAHLEQHRDELVRCLQQEGFAVIRTMGGDFYLTTQGLPCTRSMEPP